MASKIWLHWGQPESGQSRAVSSLSLSKLHTLHVIPLHSGRGVSIQKAPTY